MYILDNPSPVNYANCMTYLAKGTLMQAVEDENKKDIGAAIGWNDGNQLKTNQCMYLIMKILNLNVEMQRLNLQKELTF